MVLRSFSRAARCSGFARERYSSMVLGFAFIACLIGCQLICQARLVRQTKMRLARHYSANSAATNPTRPRAQAKPPSMLSDAVRKTIAHEIQLHVVLKERLCPGEHQRESAGRIERLAHNLVI